MPTLRVAAVVSLVINKKLSLNGEAFMILRVIGKWSKNNFDSCNFSGFKVLCLLKDYLSQIHILMLHESDSGS